MARIDVKADIEAVLNETGLFGEWTRLADALNERGITTPQGGPWKAFNLSRYCKRTFPDVSTQEMTDVPQEHTAEVTGTQEHTEIPEPVDTPNDAPQDTTEAHDVPQEDLFTGSTQEITDSAQETTVILESTDSTQETTGHDRESVSREPGAHDVPQIDLASQDQADLTELLTWWRERRNELTAHGSTQRIPASTQQTTTAHRPLFRGPRTTTKTVRMSEALAKAAASYAKRHRLQTGGTFSEFVEWLVWRELGSDERFIEASTQESTETTVE